MSDAEAFRAAVHDALSTAQPAHGLRFDSGAIPADAEGFHLLADVDALPDGDRLIVNTRVTAELHELVAERQRADELARLAIPLSRTVLLSGPPGVGKTLASRWLAQQLNLPLVSLDLASVVSSYLGSSGRNIRAVLDYAKSGPCVLLLDEFDAVAKRRDDDSDIGELKRIVNVILVELDRWPETSLLVAATNHPQLLDAAIDRRFDRVIEFPLPDQEERRALLEQANSGGGVSNETIELTAALWEGASQAVILRFWDGCRRKAVLHDTPLDEAITAECVTQFPTSALRGQVWRHAHERFGMSNRRIAGLAGLSHPTVAAGIRHAGETR
ncbi:AAA family ATPase [Rathayibacter sp. SD072]|uniref:AAA family ATPase n=1 Tax=Rathayibacter sp. SD072 TaxID=2781731 RepID=UPI001A95F831|nr:ATP-binding protein [Rathayibacter sp. SD072]